MDYRDVAEAAAADLPVTTAVAEKILGDPSGWILISRTYCFGCLDWLNHNFKLTVPGRLKANLKSGIGNGHLDRSDRARGRLDHYDLWLRFFPDIPVNQHRLHREWRSDHRLQQQRSRGAAMIGVARLHGHIPNLRSSAITDPKRNANFTFLTGFNCIFEQLRSRATTGSVDRRDPHRGLAHILIFEMADCLSRAECRMHFQRGRLPFQFRPRTQTGEIKIAKRRIQPLIV